MSIKKPDFQGDDYDFVAGSIKGLRSWGIDEKGRLRGVTHKAVWLPGDNVSTCRARTRCPQSPNQSDQWSILYGPDIPHALIKPCGVKGCEGGYHPSPHTFDRDCECGFWAYDEVGYESHGAVTGVIEGFGRTTIGTRGFRCEKARVVALARQDAENVLSLSEWLRLQQLYPDATFHDDIDAMVLAHGSVMKNWPAVEEDFWAEEPERPDSYSSQLRALSQQMAAPNASLRFSPPPSRRRWGRGSA